MYVTNDGINPFRPKGAPFFPDVAFGSFGRADNVFPAKPEWEPIKGLVLIGVVTITPTENAAFYHNVFFYRCGRQNPDYEFRFCAVRRNAIDSSRNFISSTALKERSEFLFFYDTDTHLHPDTMKRLLARMREDKNIMAISPMYRIRGYPFKMMAFAEDGLGPKALTKEQLLKRADNRGVADVDVVGNGCTLIRTEALTLWDGPWFKTGVNHTEDAWFCSLVKHGNPNARICVDTTFDCGHELIEPLVIREKNVEHMQKLFDPKKGWYYDSHA